jgi:hypothetical protein
MIYPLEFRRKQYGNYPVRPAIIGLTNISRIKHKKLSLAAEY